eukprot:g2004.t1
MPSLIAKEPPKLRVLTPRSPAADPPRSAAEDQDTKKEMLKKKKEHKKASAMMFKAAEKWHLRKKKKSKKEGAAAAEAQDDKEFDEEWVEDPKYKKMITMRRLLAQAAKGGLGVLRWKSNVSGKSGMTQILLGDDRFILKELKGSEVEILRELLPATALGPNLPPRPAALAGAGAAVSPDDEERKAKAAVALSRGTTRLLDEILTHSWVADGPGHLLAPHLGVFAVQRYISDYNPACRSWLGPRPVHTHPYSVDSCTALKCTETEVIPPARVRAHPVALQPPSTLGSVSRFGFGPFPVQGAQSAHINSGNPFLAQAEQVGGKVCTTYWLLLPNILDPAIHWGASAAAPVGQSAPRADYVYTFDLKGSRRGRDGEKVLAADYARLGSMAPIVRQKKPELHPKLQYRTNTKDNEFANTFPGGLVLPFASAADSDGFAGNVTSMLRFLSRSAFLDYSLYIGLRPHRSSCVCTFPLGREVTDLHGPGHQRPGTVNRVRVNAGQGQMLNEHFLAPACRDKNAENSANRSGGEELFPNVFSNLKVGRPTRADASAWTGKRPRDQLSPAAKAGDGFTYAGEEAQRGDAPDTSGSDCTFDVSYGVIDLLTKFGPGQVLTSSDDDESDSDEDDAGSVSSSGTSTAWAANLPRNDYGANLKRAEIKVHRAYAMMTNSRFGKYAYSAQKPDAYAARFAWALFGIVLPSSREQDLRKTTGPPAAIDVELCSHFPSPYFRKDKEGPKRQQDAKACASAYAMKRMSGTTKIPGALDEPQQPDANAMELTRAAPRPPALELGGASPEESDSEKNEAEKNKGPTQQSNAADSKDNEKKKNKKENRKGKGSRLFRRGRP